MSQEQSLSTEDLAARQAPDTSTPVAPPAEPPAREAAGPIDPVQPQTSGEMLGVHRTTDSDRYGEPDEINDRTAADRISDEQSDLPDGATTDDRQASATDDSQGQPDDEDVSLFDTAQAQGYRARWGEVQVRFVDDPREAVSAADALVAEAMQTLAAAFADHKSRLETQWQGGGDVDTEELRVALRRYRVFFHRLLET